MTTVSTAAAALASHGIHCRRDWGSPGHWLAEVGLTQYCVGGLALVEAAASVDPISILEFIVSDNDLNNIGRFVVSQADLATIEA